MNNEISKNEVILALKHLKAGKATGIDGIPIEFYKHASHILVTPLCSWFNYVLSKGEYPSGWSEGIISPIHKKGSTTDTSNYRKVTVMPSIGKIFDSILKNRLIFKNEVLLDDDKFQAGFKKWPGLFAPSRGTQGKKSVLDNP